jgi:serralysin
VLVTGSYSLFGTVVELMWLKGTSDAILTGNSLHNTIFAGAGNDTLYGMAGYDKLYGGAGIDTLIGGSGKDTFSAGSSWEMDTIVDFEQGLDRIDFSYVGDLTFIGTERFHGVAGELHVYHLPDGNTYASADRDGDGRPEAAIKVLGFHNLTSADFIL